MSKFSPHVRSCQRQFSKKVESLAPTVIPRGFLNQLGFAMWTPTTRQKHSRTVTRYQTDLTDTQWRVIAPHLPKPCAAGRPREWPMREIVNGIFYVMRSGCPWRLVPSDLPPWGTIYRWFAAWRDDGRFCGNTCAPRPVRLDLKAPAVPRSDTDHRTIYLTGIDANGNVARSSARRSQRPLFWAITIGCPKNANGFQKTAIVWSLITKLNIPHAVPHRFAVSAHV
jgi:Putative transposase of IS4/5 family (DUF4096)